MVVPHSHQKIWRVFFKAYGSEQTITHPHLPTVHGLVERVNKKTLDYLKMLLNQIREMEFEELRNSYGEIYNEQYHT